MSDVAQPKVSPPVLPELFATPAASLEPQDLREGERITGQGLTRLDATRATIRLCEVLLTGIGELTLDHSRLIDSWLRDPEIATLAAPESTWRGVAVDGGRLGVLEAPASHWDGAVVTAIRVGFLNLRDATVGDVRLDGCRIDTLDLSGATVTRLSLAGCTIGELLVSRARLADVDLRGAEMSRIDDATALAGAVVSPTQLLDLAPLLAAALGIRVQADD